MYHKHPNLEEPSDPSRTIWRYMSLEKFKDLLETKSLYFASVFQFEDNLECTLSEKDYENISISDHGGEKVLEGIIRDYIKINCWNMSDKESPRLWKEYTDNTGVVLRSTFKKLMDSFQDTPFTISATTIKYIDRAIDQTPGRVAYERIQHKDKKFEHEQELRLFTGLDWSESKGVPTFPKSRQGEKILFDMNISLEKIRIGPESSKLEFQNTQSLLQKYDVSVELEHSELKQESKYESHN